MPQVMLPNPLGAAQAGQDLRRQRQLNALGDMEVANAPAAYAREQVMQGREDKQYQAGIDAASAKQAVAAAQWVRQSASPKQAVLSQFPELIPQLQQHGFDINTASDDDVRELAAEFEAHFSSSLGVGPPKPEQYTLNPGDVRMEGNRQVASAPTAAPQPQGFELSPGQTRFGPDGRAIASLPAAPQAGSAPPSGYRYNPDGSLAAIPGGPADASNKTRPQTEYDRKAQLLFSEMKDAANQYDAAPGADTSSAWNASLGTNPVTRYFTSNDYRQHEAAGLRWAQNFLYLKSGQSAPAEEVRKTMVQYMPQPGDGPAVIKQKAEAREQAQQNVANANGIPYAPSQQRGASGGWTVTEIK